MRVYSTVRFVLVWIVVLLQPLWAQPQIDMLSGNSLQAWEVLPYGSWSLTGGTLTGVIASSEKNHGMLLSKSSYRDFVLDLDFYNSQGNSGLYFRAQRANHPAQVHGFQAEVDASTKVGGVYETLGRGWVCIPDTALTKKIYRPNDWNHLRVETKGRSFKVWLNHVITSEMSSDTSRLEGKLGLQLHGNMDMEVKYRNIFLYTSIK